jgi:hypothetical protein
MDPNSFLKQSWEQRQLEFDVTDALSSGDSVASALVTVWDGTPTDLSSTMVHGTVAIQGNKVYVSIKGGTSGSIYWIRVRVTTTNGDLIEDDLELTVQDMGA